MRILLAGASGFLGTALRQRLTDDGHAIRSLVRSDPRRPDDYRWDPYQGSLPAEALHGVDAVVNLAGAPIAHWPWTTSYRKVLLESRVSTTGTIAGALTGLGGAPPTLVNASAIGYYGKDRGDEDLDEKSAPGDGLLADVVAQWEAATRPVSEAGGRVVLLRSAVVLDERGGALKVMKRPFRLGVGGRLGDGRQWFPTISLEDWLSAVSRAITDSEMGGPYNLVAPEPATNADLTRLLGGLLHRPTVMRVPAFALKAILGELSGEVLGSLKVHPTRLSEVGFTFTHPDLESQLGAALR
ncbi:MAG: TIGR01777 family oxidoreductase [Actinomycetota bacterium]|nr:TIGR01777 family oxidoreductase [Actinomycetota bacterium]